MIHPTLTRMLRVSITITVATLAACSGSMPSPDVVDAAATEAASDAMDAPSAADVIDVVDVDTNIAPPDGFMTAAHPPLTTIPDQGGPTLQNVQLVVITFADDDDRTTHEAFTQWIVTSDWLANAGAEYGVGIGSILGVVERTDDAPNDATDAEIQALLLGGVEDGSIPRPADGTFDDALYLIFYPEHTRVSITSPRAPPQFSCTDFGGYHSEAQNADLDFAYAVVPSCMDFEPGLTTVQGNEVATSHEIFEGITDPLPITSPAYAFGRESTNPWVLVGGELADLCSVPSFHAMEDGYTLQRVWSNAAALAGLSDPCVPAPAVPPYYYDVTVIPSDIQEAAAGTAATFTLYGFSYGPVADWTVSAAARGTFMPTFMATPTTLNNGETATLTVNVPVGTPSGSYALIYIYAAHSMSEYRNAVAAVYVP